MSVRRVAVVGAGISGLVSVKSCLEESLEPVCFEQHDDIGGIWYDTEDFRVGQNARIYDCLVLNTSKGYVCFSDFPFPNDTPPYPTGKQMYDYIKKYAKNFNLLKHIQLNTKVCSVKRSAEYESTGCWDVQTEVAGKRIWATFDAVLVCSGFYTSAHYPTIDGLDQFKGIIEHSQTFKCGSRYRNRRVLVVDLSMGMVIISGNSNSAGDIAADTSRYAQVYLSVGTGTWVVPRCQANGIPLDFLLKRIMSLFHLPQWLLGLYLVKQANARFDHMKAKLASEDLPPKGAVMVNDEIQMRIMCGAVKIVGSVMRFGERHAEFDDGTRVSDLDVVLFATGLQRGISFLEPFVGANQDKLEWYKMVFPVHLPHHTLAVTGYIRTQGSVVPISELQARLAARVLAGNHKLPDRSVMGKDIDRWNREIFKTYGTYKYAFPNVPFRDELAEELGVKPSLLDLLKLGPTVAYQYYFGPAFNVHHRLTGPGAWEGAVQTCAREQHGAYPAQLRKLEKASPRKKNLKVFLLLTLLTLLIGMICVQLM